jgi:hypothetical protein
MPLVRVESAADALSLQGGGGDGLAMPEMGDVQDFAMTRAASASLWWGIASIVLCIGLLLHSGLDVRSHSSDPTQIIASHGAPIYPRRAARRCPGGWQLLC